jgi:protein TonB
MKFAVFPLGILLLGSVPAVRADFEPPVPVRTVAPEFPSEMRRQHMNGLVLVDCEIDSHGDVQDPKVAKTSNDAFTQPALDALKRWKFKPAQRDGNNVAVRVKIPLRFTVDD